MRRFVMKSTLSNYPLIVIETSAFGDSSASCFTATPNASPSRPNSKLPSSSYTSPCLCIRNKFLSI